MTSQRTLLITGGSGYLGRHLTLRAAEAGFNVYATYHTGAGRITAGHPLPLDVGNRAGVMELITRLSPQAIIHTAAANPGQGNKAVMTRTNSTGSRHIAEAAAATGARLVHLSTDVVHNGRHAPYTDDAPPSPLNPYGRTKAAAEAAVRQVAPAAVIVRTSLIYGLAEMDRGTAGFAARLSAGQPLVLFNDVIRQPVWVETLVEALLRLVDTPFAGVLNVAGRQALTREAFGRRMLDWWQVSGREQVTAGRAADVSDTIPLDLRLHVHRAERLLQMAFPGVDEVLANASG